MQLDEIVTPIVGLVAIGGGLFFLWEWRKKELECKITDLNQHKKTRDRIKELAMSKFTFLTFIGILAIAFSVNIIEFACSIGIPQAFTKILELNRLPLGPSLGLIGIYILFYMIDDFIVFGIALYGADKLALTTKYSKLSNLIGGIVMILLGLLLIFHPSFLYF
ncbi:MAG: Glutaredoxin domain protein [Microgenomates group bacterium GW2011_GWC1_41_8]|nr:MAG: Glutaredoxin domain protein [Microgenomates group bacterium GW2011_GWC1_41_8]